ncbi:hypothetical protein PAMA_001580 [Pampus argenteus]
MDIQCKVVILILALTLNDQVHSGEIIGGHVTAPHTRPYMVLLERMVENNKIKHCGGFLVNEDFVMTAAHCQAKSYKVLLGKTKFDKEKEGISVEKVFPHEDYNRYKYQNDIMLLKMSSKANFSKDVRSIALADQGVDSLPKSCTVSGWGKTGNINKHMSLVLMEVNVTLIDKKMCFKEKSYCSTGDTGPAEGDSGGPLVCEDGKAYGVVSSTYRRLLDSQPIYHYVNIPNYRSWIDMIMKK